MEARLACLAHLPLCFHHEGREDHEVDGKISVTFALFVFHISGVDTGSHLASTGVA